VFLTIVIRQWVNDFFAQVFFSLLLVKTGEDPIHCRSQYDQFSIGCRARDGGQRRYVSWGYSGFDFSFYCLTSSFKELPRFRQTSYNGCLVWKCLWQLLCVADTTMPNENRMNSIILLRHTLGKIPPILEALRGCRSGLLGSIQTVTLLHSLISVMLGSKDTCCHRTYSQCHQWGYNLDQRRPRSKTPTLLCSQSRYPLNTYWRLEWSERFTRCCTSKFQRSHIRPSRHGRCLQK